MRTLFWQEIIIALENNYCTGYYAHFVLAGNYLILALVKDHFTNLVTTSKCRAFWDKGKNVLSMSVFVIQRW